MSDAQARLGHSLLKSIVELKQSKKEITLEDLGGMFEEIAQHFGGQGSNTDRFMHQEIARLARYIQDAKKEIFSIATNNNAEPAIVDASAHLDEVIKATESATNNIMDAVDTISNNASGIGGEKEQQILDATTRIYEACNFQDVTGQRIRKVIKLLENIEERIGKLNELFGNDEDLMRSVQETKPDPMSDSALMNGPQLSNQASSQADIDALFASMGGKT
ncbi:MAG: protein phosphatase CheZ [Rickettsiales bacterium]|jgi:chemotaxis protein CheZ|nr:protein phosphatase CheZ [Rickettsiales bacterium]